MFFAFLSYFFKYNSFVLTHFQCPLNSKHRIFKARICFISQYFYPLLSFLQFKQLHLDIHTPHALIPSYWHTQWRKQVWKNLAAASVSKCHTKPRTFSNSWTPVWRHLRNHVNIIYFRDKCRCQVFSLEKQTILSTTFFSLKQKKANTNRCFICI